MSKKSNYFSPEVRERAVQGQRDPQAGQRVFRPGGARPPSEGLKKFVDQHRQAHGVESICKVLQIAPSGYWRHATQQRNPQRRCPRAQRDDTLVPHIERVWKANMRVYGADKVWKQMNRERVVHCPLLGRALDAALGTTRRAPWQGVAHHDQRRQVAIPAGQGQSGLQSRAAQPALGIGLAPTSPPGKAGCTWPLAIAFQKGPRSARCKTGGLPGERSFPPSDRSDFGFFELINTSDQEVLRRLVEFTGLT